MSESMDTSRAVSVRPGHRYRLAMQSETRARPSYWPPKGTLSAGEALVELKLRVTYLSDGGLPAQVVRKDNVTEVRFYGGTDRIYLWAEVVGL